MENHQLAAVLESLYHLACSLAEAQDSQELYAIAHLVEYAQVLASN